MILFDNIYKSFGQKQVLQGLNLEIMKGESLVLLGRSGTGKSVTLKCLLGLLKPDKGHIKIDDQPVTKSIYDRVGMLFQSSALFDSLPVWKNIAFRFLERRDTNAMQKAIDLLDKVGLSPGVANQYPSELSGGMQKRVGLARALAADPDIMLFDEPTTGLDPISAKQINSLIANLRKERGSTSLTITHDLHSARQIADRVALIHNGCIVWTGSTNELDTSEIDYIRQFVDCQVEGPLTRG